MHINKQENSIKNNYSEFYDNFPYNNRIDHTIYESEKEMQEGAEAIDLDEAFNALNKKYYG